MRLESSSSWNALNPLSSYVYRLIYLYVLTQVWRPCRDVIFHVWLKQTIRIFLPCKFTAECTNKRFFIILEVGIFQNQNCDLISIMVCHLPAIWSVIFQVLHFPALRFGPSLSSISVRHFPGPAFSSPVIWSTIFQVLHFPVFDGSCKFSAPYSVGLHAIIFTVFSWY